MSYKANFNQILKKIGSDDKCVSIGELQGLPMLDFVGGVFPPNVQLVR